MRTKSALSRVDEVGVRVGEFPALPPQSRASRQRTGPAAEQVPQRGRSPRPAHSSTHPYSHPPTQPSLLTQYQPWGQARAQAQGPAPDAKLSLNWANDRQGRSSGGLGRPKTGRLAAGPTRPLGTSPVVRQERHYLRWFVSGLAGGGWGGAARSDVWKRTPRAGRTGNRRPRAQAEIRPLEGQHEGDDVTLFLVGEKLLESRHSAATLVEVLENIFRGGVLAAGQLAVLNPG